MVKSNKGITLISLIVTVIILLILAGVSIRALTGSKGLINQAKATKMAAEMQDIEDQVDLIVAKCEVKSFNVTMQLIIKQLIKEEIITDEAQVDPNTGDITFDNFVLKGKLAKYVITPEERYYGDKNTVVTNPSYFTFTVDENAGTATITGVKDEYAVKAYQDGEETQYTVVIKDGETYIKDVVIPYEVTHADGKQYQVTAIGNYAFQGLTGTNVTNVDERFTSFVLPNTVTSIGIDTFKLCRGLTKIEIPNSVTSLGSNAFRQCISLTNINIPNSVKTIGSCAFWYCTNLSSVKLPNSINSIPDHIFYGCTSLSSINIPNSVTNIGDYAFSLCTNLSSVNIPNGVTSIGNYLFYNCNNLSSINIPSGVTNIGNAAFAGCGKLSSVNIPDGLTSIGSQAFANCTSLSEVKIPSNVTSIEYQVFYNCRNLEKVNIPDGVTKIGSMAFYNCVKLSCINIPRSVLTIDTLAFRVWTANQTINCEILETEKPETWDAQWDYYNTDEERKATLNWGVSM